MGPDQWNEQQSVVAQAAKAAAADNPTEHTIGTAVGSSRIDNSLRRGGTGTAYLAYDTKLHRQVALKMMSASTEGQTSRTMLLQEARNAAALNHPHICTIYEG